MPLAYVFTHLLVLGGYLLTYLAYLLIYLLTLSNAETPNPSCAYFYVYLFIIVTRPKC